jgi:hypothetical protein
MKITMSAKRLVSLFAALALVVVVLLTVQAQITAANVVSSPQAAVDQAVAREPRYNPSSAAVLAEQARLEFRRGEWNAGSRSSQSYDMPAASNVVSNPQAAVDQAGSRSSQPYYKSVVPSLSWRMAPTSDYAPVGQSAVPTPGWRMAPTSDYVPVGQSFHTPPTSPDRHR